MSNNWKWPIAPFGESGWRWLILALPLTPFLLALLWGTEIRVGGERVDYIEYYDYQRDELALVGRVEVGGQPRHTLGGFNLPYRYSLDGQYQTAKELLPIMGCPEWADAEELEAIGQGAEILPGMA